MQPRLGAGQRLEGGAAYFTVRIRPYRRQVALIVRDLVTQRRSGVRSRHAACGLAALHRKRVFDAIAKGPSGRLSARPCAAAVPAIYINARVPSQVQPYRTHGPLLVDIDRNVVHRVLSKHYRPTTDGTGAGPSWLSFIGHTKDSLWSVDLFRCESIVLRSYWVLIVMDQCTRRLVGFGVQCGVLTGATCVGVQRRDPVASKDPASPQHGIMIHYFEAHRWPANLRILEIDEIKTVPHVPLSHPYVERLIGTIRREFLDDVPFWNGPDLERKLPILRPTTTRHAATRPCRDKRRWPSPVVK